jgi:Ca-activated chloride channel family protein
MTKLRLLAGACAALLATVASARAVPADDDRTLSPYFVVSGAEPGVDALPLKSTRVDASVSGVIAEVTVRQRYRNDGSTPLEARYVFPASTRAAVAGLRLRVGERVVDAEIREKRQARAEFVQAKREGRRAALLEQHRPNVFQMAVANVMPGEEIAVELRYSELIVPTDGVYRFVYPTVVGPRYVSAPAPESSPAGGEAPAREPPPQPSPASGGGSTAKGEEGSAATGGGAIAAASGESFPSAGAFPPPLAGEVQGGGQHGIAHPFLRKGRPAPHTFELHARIAAPLPVRTLSSPTHAVAVEGVGSDNATFSLAPDSTHADRDVVVEYRLAGAAIDAGILLQPGRDENFFLALVQPPARVDATDILPREYVFIVDVSGSMRGFPLDTAKRLLRSLIGSLRPTDTFNVIPFAGGLSQLAPQSVPASAANIATALRFIDGQTGGGGTELLPALRFALAMPADETRARTFIVVTDGYVTIEKEAFDLVRESLGRANLFAFGIGSSVNRHLIEGLARAGQGEPFVVLDGAQADAQAARLRRMIEAPVLTRVRVSFDGFDAYDVDPPHVPDLFAHRPLVLVGKYRGKPSGSITIEGFSGGGAWRRTLEVLSPPPQPSPAGGGGSEVTSAEASAASGGGSEATNAEAFTASGGGSEAASGGSATALRALWARSRVQTLTDSQRLRADDTTRAAILRLGLAYGLLTDYTSFIAVDKVIVNPGGQGGEVDHASPLPAGVEETALAKVPSTPEPEFYALAALAAALTWWSRRRRRVGQVRHG